jgi:CubicO group peptidase (beta-lactamase class C family)
VRDPIPNVDLNVLAGAGMVKATAADLVAFVRFQLAADDDAICTKSPQNGRLCEAKKLAQSPQTDDGRMGLLFDIAPFGPEQRQTMYAKRGADWGFTSDLAFDRDRKLGVVVLSNTLVRPDGLWTSVFDIDVPVREWANVTPEVALGYSGVYADANFTVDVRAHNGVFGIRLPGPDRLPGRLWATSPATAPPTTFALRDLDTEVPITFVPATSTSPAKLRADFGGATFELTRQP